MKSYLCLFFFCFLPIFADQANAATSSTDDGLVDAREKTCTTSLHLGDGTVISRPLLAGTSQITSQNGTEWALKVESTTVPDHPDSRDYSVTWTLVKGHEEAASFGVDFNFDWSPDNFVFIPASVYDGNRFATKVASYPPYWYDKSEWRLDMPTTVARGHVPTLGTDGAPGRIQIDTGYASTPLVGFQSPATGTGWMVLTTQGSRHGNHGLIVEEGDGRKTARIGVIVPDVHAMEWKEGDTLTLPFRVYSFPAATRTVFLKRFMQARKDLNPVERKEVLPFSGAWKITNQLMQNDRWDEGIGMYCLSKPDKNPKRPWNYIWQLGWCGGGQVTLPILMQGDEPSRQRAMRNLEVIFAKTQAKSGFFNAIGNGKEFASFGFTKLFQNNESLVRSQGDWLYMAQRQFQCLQVAGVEKVPKHWQDGIRKLADVFAALWEKRGQFGQFVDVQTGDLCIGGSVSGGIVPGGMALASKTFDCPRYLAIAKAAARKYHADFIQKGYTTGGPGEILSAPDSESAFGLFESLMALHEVTGEKEWLEKAGDLLPICASWTVSYDFQFPPQSIMGKLDAHSTGACWASVVNKHGAPAICTWSGDSLLKYYRATGDPLALDLCRDIAHGVPQYISRNDRPIGKLPSGGACERVNLSSWEGPANVGGNLFGSCSWVETAALLTFAQIPGLYVQPDSGVFYAFDNITAEKVSHSQGKLKLRLTNPTKFPADVRVLVERSKEAKQPKAFLVAPGLRTIHLEPGDTQEVEFAS